MDIEERSWEEAETNPDLSEKIESQEQDTTEVSSVRRPTYLDELAGMSD